jgi:hypothetical protein
MDQNFLHLEDIEIVTEENFQRGYTCETSETMDGRIKIRIAPRLDMPYGIVRGRLLVINGHFTDTIWVEAHLVCPEIKKLRPIFLRQKLADKFIGKGVIELKANSMYRKLRSINSLDDGDLRISGAINALGEIAIECSDTFGEQSTKLRTAEVVLSNDLGESLTVWVPIGTDAISKTIQ